MNTIRRTAAVVLAAAATFSLAQAPALAAVTGRVDVAAGNTLKIRSTPSTSGAVLGSLADGASISITCKTTGTTVTGTFGTTSQWDKVGSGYVSHAYVSAGTIPACTTTTPPPATNVQAAVVAKAKALVGAYPYVTNAGNWYGPTSGGFDCSGLTMYVWYQASSGAGQLSHNSGAQYNQGRRVPIAQRQAGDLLFWSTNAPATSGIHHVAVYIGGNQYVGAQSTALGIRLVTLNLSNAELMPYVVRPLG